MPAKRSVGTSRSLLFINTLLLSTAIALPAMAQIEEVVVTAQKKTEDVQNVPIAVTAFTGQDLKTEQIEQFKDIQFHAPDVTYTAGNFGGADFQIRGIGVTAVGYDSESGVAINFDEVFLSAPQLTEGSFYDMSGLEVLAGPQSTLYGRGATGGVVNLNINKPDLEQASAQVIGSYGNYDAAKVTGIVNLPLINDQLGLRIAGEWDDRNGFVTNIYNGSNVDGLDQYSIRPTLRWQPTDQTTIDFTGQFTREDDTHMRADKQLCTTDPTGVLGCLPGSAGTQPVNSYATLSTIYSSQQALTPFLESVGFPAALGEELGIYNLQNQNTLPPGYVDPTGDRQIDTDFTPIWHSGDNFMSLKWQQQIRPWLASTMVFGYDHDYYESNESYNNIPGQTLPYNAAALTGGCAAPLAGTPSLACAEATFMSTITSLYGASYASNYAAFFSKPGYLPYSSTANLGVTGGSYTYSNSAEAFDQSDGESSEYSWEWRLASSFSGPLNGMLGFYYLHTHVTGDYYVNATTLDYPGIVLGGLLGPGDAAAFGSTACNSGCILGPSYYHNDAQDVTLTSKAVFGEAYYDILPDTLKLTGGIRFTEDDKYETGRIVLYSGFVPLGTTSESYFPTNTSSISLACTSGCPDIPVQQEFNAWTGRAVLDWTPKLDFTDQTLIYASYSTGYKAGGANPFIEPGLPVPQTYAPENIDAYEIGTKNMLLGNTLQANGDIYYYNYKGLQVSTIQYNTSVNDNISAHLWGSEGNLLWQATDRIQLGFNVAQESSQIQNTSLVDPANPTGGNPQTVLIKDDTLSADAGENCVVYFTGAFPGLPSGYIAPAGGTGALASSGIPNVAFGSCNPANLAAFHSFNSRYALPSATGAQSYEGQAVSLDGHSLQNTPNLSFGASAQYTQPLASDWALTLRTDIHYQTHFWGTIFEDGASHIGDEYVWDASLRLTPPEDSWYATVFIKNITNQNNITGEYVTSQTSGLYTNAFYGDPRTYGIEIGMKL